MLGQKSKSQEISAAHILRFHVKAQLNIKDTESCQRKEKETDKERKYIANAHGAPNHMTQQELSCDYGHWTHRSPSPNYSQVGLVYPHPS